MCCMITSVLIMLFIILKMLIPFDINVDTVAECVKYVEPAAPRSVEADTLPDLQQLYFCPKCVRSCRPPLDVLYTLTCSLQNLVITLPEATAAQNLHRRAVCWRDEVQRVLQSDEVRAVQNEHAEISLLSRLARSHSGYIFQRGIIVISTCLLDSFTSVFLKTSHMIFWSCIVAAIGAVSSTLCL